jgi:outer membrane protein OmpA-like peptidoglycan-associated protein
MSRATTRAVLLAVSMWLATTATLAAPAKPDPDRDRLQAELTALDQDPALAPLAGLERFRARQFVAALPNPSSRERAQALMLAELWVEAARIAAQAQHLEDQSRQLDRERDQIMLEASRRDAELARREADRLRLQTQAQQEEAERLAAQAEADRQAGQQAAADAQAATAEAAQARKLADAREHEAQLAREEARLASETNTANNDAGGSLPPSRQVAGKTVYTLSGSAFASGSARLTDSARASLRRLAAVLPARAKLRIEGHTDSQGVAAANLALSQQRAEAVRQALVEAGIAPARLKAIGLGQTVPVADNGSAEGRARNRRVELTVQ